jgi:hypothetical protein
MDISPFVNAGAGTKNDGIRIGRKKAAIIPGVAGVDRPAVRHPVYRALPGACIFILLNLHVIHNAQPSEKPAHPESMRRNIQFTEK